MPQEIIREEGESLSLIPAYSNSLDLLEISMRSEALSSPIIANMYRDFQSMLHTRVGLAYKCIF